jgi:hypothetical protein
MQNDLLRLLNGTFPDGPRKDVWDLSDKFAKVEQKLRGHIFDKNFSETQVIKLTNLAGLLATSAANFAIWTEKDDLYVSKMLALYKRKYETLREAARHLENMADRVRLRSEGGFYAD